MNDGKIWQAGKMETGEMTLSPTTAELIHPAHTTFTEIARCILATGPEEIVIDLSGVSVIDGCILTAFNDLARRVQGQPIKLLIVTNHRVERILRESGLGSTFKTVRKISQ